MSLTSSTEVLLICCAGLLLAAYGLSWGVSRRRRPGRGTSKLLVFIFFFVLTFFVPTTVWLAQAAYKLVSYPSYSATVVGYSTEDRRIGKNYSGSRHRRSRVMYTPLVRFTEPWGDALELPTTTSSSKPPVEGSLMTVVYAPGDSVAQELSAKSVGLLLGGGVMLFGVGYGLWAAVWYAMGRAMAGVSAFGSALLLKFVLPGAMLLMTLGLASAPVRYFFDGNPDKFPIWVVLICSLFALVLLGVLGAWLVALWQDRGRRA